MKQILIVIAGAAVVAFAGDPWTAKKASDWTEKETERILTNSPWAIKVTLESNVPSAGAPRVGMGGPGGGMSGPGEGMGGPGGGMGGPGGGMGGPGGGMGGPSGGIGPPGGMELPKVTVRWESAEPVREASSRAESPTRNQFSEWVKEYYVLSISGMPAMRLGGQAPDGPGRGSRGPGAGDSGSQGGGPQPDSERMQQMQRLMQAASTLKPKRKEAILPARVETVVVAGTMLTVFLFPRTQAISLEDKEVTFQTALGPMRVKSKFKLKDMQYLGKLAL